LDEKKATLNYNKLHLYILNEFVGRELLNIAIPKGFSSTRGIKHCEKMVNPNQITINKRLFTLIGLCTVLRNDFIPRNRWQ